MYQFSPQEAAQYYKILQRLLDLEYWYQGKKWTRNLKWKLIIYEFTIHEVSFQLSENSHQVRAKKLREADRGD